MVKGDFARFFEGKTVTLMGLGLLGRGVGDAAFLARFCKKVFVTDMKTAAELSSSVEALRRYDNIEFCLGGHDFSLFENKNFIVKGAGVRQDNPYVKHAADRGIPIHMSTALFAFLSPIKTIGVTGTRGKTTVAAMIAHILEKSGKRPLLGGNIRGMSTLAHLEDDPPCDHAVLELDSWQLQGFDSLGISPSIGVFTTFYPDHMNYYDGDMERYLYDKASIFRHQKAGDLFVTTEAVEALVGKALKQSATTSVVVSLLPSSYTLKIPGEHNRVNAALAAAAARACGVLDEEIREALASFEGVEGRLQKVGSWKQRDFYNDSNATTQEATLAALKALPPEKTVLIAGGADKGLPVDALTSFLLENKVRIVFIKGTGTDRLLPKFPNVPVVGSMAEAMNKATHLSQEGDCIILSPAFASFGVFKNEYDRSDQFLKEVKNLLSQEEGNLWQH